MVGWRARVCVCWRHASHMTHPAHLCAIHTQRVCCVCARTYAIRACMRVGLLAWPCWVEPPCTAMRACMRRPYAPRACHCTVQHDSLACQW